MIRLNEKYVTDKSGKSKEVILNHGQYLRLLEYLEDIEDRLEIKRRKKSARFVPWNHQHRQTTHERPHHRSMPAVSDNQRGLAHDLLVRRALDDDAVRRGRHLARFD